VSGNDAQAARFFAVVRCDRDHHPPDDLTRRGQSVFDGHVYGVTFGKTYTAAEPAYSIYSVVPAAAPSDQLNRLIWGYVRGWNTTYPAVRHAAFSPFSVDVGDNQREEAGLRFLVRRPR
jgi:hypothetical protein